MKNLFIVLGALLVLLAACATEQETSTNSQNPVMKVNYPITQKTDQQDDYHGTSIKDPYRWLEDDRSTETEAWVKAQNEVTFDYLENIPFRDKIRERYEELFNYPKLSSPFKAGDYYFFYKNDGLQNQSVIYIQKGLDGEPEVFLDPNTMSEDGTVAINLNGISKDNKYISYAQSAAGSDWQEIHVMEIATKRKLPDVLEYVKFSGASWKGDGFYYSRYPAPEENSSGLSAANQFHSVYYHKLGEPQEKDELIYRDEQNPNYNHNAGVTEDEAWLVMTASSGTDGFETYVKDLSQPRATFIPLFTGFKHKNSVLSHRNGKLLVRSNIDAPNYRVIEVDPKNPAKENWKIIIPEKENLLNSVNTGGGQLFASYLKNATTRIYRYDMDGGSEQEIKLPGLGSANGFGGRKDYTTLFYTFTSFTYPPTIFKYDVATGQSEQFFKTPLKFNPEDFVEKQVFYKSKDGTEVSMFVVHKKDLPMDGQRPTYLYGYGGFNISLTPSFSTSRIILLENDGVFAMPNLRGGGEYGEDWHQDGMLLKKQNVFDDFIAAGEYLIDEGYTSKGKLAIAGGSNGGLLVGACMTQRPDLFAVAIPAVGVLDMLRYHKFTIGHAWAVEYGSSEDPEHFKNLLAYSPLHNLKPGTAYPATMVTTADHDDRVVPAHSFKFAAALQEAHAGDEPVLIRIETDAGHGAGKPTSKIIDEQADIWSFVFYNTNSPVRYLEN
ncbi:MAG: prolyl oligopeptidase family serine peptidase [Bacteroidota bacterium]